MATLPQHFCMGVKVNISLFTNALRKVLASTMINGTLSPGYYIYEEIILCRNVCNQSSVQSNLELCHCFLISDDYRVCKSCMMASFTTKKFMNMQVVDDYIPSGCSGGNSFLMGVHSFS